LLDPPLPGLRDRPVTLARIHAFADKMAHSGPQGWVQSLRNFGDRIRWMASARWNALLATRLRVPAAAKLVDRTSLNVHAAIQYRPAAFPGPLTVFLTQAGGANFNRFAESEWVKLAAQLDLVGVHGDHHDFIHAPYVEELAGQLIERLRPAQERCRPAPKKKLA
jgi:thioesterase domain-containing protein